MSPSKDFTVCIVCRKRPPDSKEHIIPACIGGTFEAKILCTPCNSTFGTGLVSQLKHDPSIRVAITHLRDKIPHLAANFEEGLNFIAKSAEGQTVIISQKRGKWKIKAMEATGHLVMDTAEVPTYVRNRLKKQGVPGG